MSELTEEEARERLTDLVGAARVLRDAINGLSREAAQPHTPRSLWRDSLAGCLEVDREAAGDLADELGVTLRRYEERVEKS